MSDQSDELTVCPHCGGKNLAHATRCVHCGEDMDSIFAFGDEEPGGAEGVPEGTEERDSIPEVLRGLREGDVFEPVLGAESSIPAEESRKSETEENFEKPADQSAEPDWLQRIRQRAQQEFYNGADRKKDARDALSTVDQEFNDWIARIREKTQREALNQARAQDAETPSDATGTPEWLRKVRALHPRNNSATGSDEGNPAEQWETEWTDERLRALREEALAEESATGLSKEITSEKPSTDEAEAPADDREQTALPEKVESTPAIPEEASAVEPFHNIPEEEELAEIPLEAVEPTAAFEPERVNRQEPVEQAPKSTDEVVSEEATAPGGEEHPAAAVEPLPVEPILTQAGLAVEAEALQTVEALDEAPKYTGDAPSDLVLLRAQKEFADLLKSMIDQEGKPGLLPKASKAEPGGINRFVLAFLLLAALVATLIISPGKLVPTRTPNSAASAFADAVGSLNDQSRVLVVTDYQAATSAEMELVLPPVLRQLEEKKVTWEVLTTQPSGLWLTGSILEAANLSSQPKVNYLPGGSFGLVALANGLRNETPRGSFTSILPEAVQDLRTYDLILLACDSELETRTWMEQVAPWLGARRIVMVSTMQTAPMLLPYFDSGQIAGYMGELNNQTVNGTEAGGFPARVFQVGLLVLLVLLLLGMIVKADQDSFQQTEEKGEE